MRPWLAGASLVLIAVALALLLFSEAQEDPALQVPSVLPTAGS